MVDGNDNEKREFVRTDLSIQADLVPIGPQELSRLRYLKQMFSNADEEAPGRAGADPSGLCKHAINDLAELLIRTNEKIDRIMDFLGITQTDAEGLQVVRTVNISGSGISLVITHPLEKGQLLDISLSIPGFPLGLFRAQGEVRRIRPLKGPDAHLYEAGIKFLHLTEHQQERLISFTFRQQRKTIRKRKDYA